MNTKPKNQHKNKEIYWTKLKEKWKMTLKYLDKPIILLVSVLILFGLINLFSTIMYTDSEPIKGILKQIISIIIGLILGWGIFKIPVKFFDDLKVLVSANFFVFIILVVTLIRGTISGGAKSWIYLFGFSFQPSELFKILSIISMSWEIGYVNREVVLTKETIQKNKMFWILNLMMFLNLLMIILQPDLGMVLIIGASVWLLWSIHMFSKKVNLIMYSIVIALVAFVHGFANYFAEDLIVTDNHMLQRIGIFVNPFIDKSKVGYQSINGYVAFSRGGWSGVGLGNGVMKRGRLPEIHNDFILANIAEENGFLFVLLIFILYWILFYIIFRRAAESRDEFRSRVISGLGILLFVQTSINIGGVLGIIPLTGVTLPLLSAGGSSMIITLICISIILKMIYEDRMDASKILGEKVDYGKN